MKLRKNIIISLKLILVGVVVASIIYPLLVGGIAQLWPDKARGSLIYDDGEAIGSKIIGQNFEEAHFFKSRPSSINYDARRSSSANLAPNNPLLTDRVKSDLVEIEANYGSQNIIIPADFLTESASALDPHISPAAAYLQVEYISQHSGIEVEKLNSLIAEHTLSPLFSLFGEERVNVLELNLSLKGVMEND